MVCFQDTKLDGYCKELLIVKRFFFFFLKAHKRYLCTTYLGKKWTRIFPTQRLDYKCIYVDIVQFLLQVIFKFADARKLKISIVQVKQYAFFEK